MNFLYSLSGAQVPVIKEFDINKDETIHKGELVFLNEGGRATNSSICPIIGISAEDHTRTEDFLNPRSNGDKIMVDITVGGVYEMEPMILVARPNGDERNFVFDAEGLRSGIGGGKLVLIKKGEGSTNTDEIGTVREVEFSSVMNDLCTFSVNVGGVACDGDVYKFYPPAGTNGALALDGKNFAVSSIVPVALTVVGYDLTREKIEVMLRNKHFENL